jgi:Na+/H+ antiporter NhaD/arsenite permease-like protein
MLTALVAIFVLAYAAIALEHPLKINKSASALVGAGVLWTIYALSSGDHHKIGHELGHSLMGTAQIVFFLMGAMTIVEVVDAHNGFEVITQRIRTTRLSKLMWLVRFRHLLPLRAARQPDDDHRHDLADAQAAVQPGRPPVLRRHHRHRRQRGRRLVADRRRDHDHALDRWPDHDDEHHFLRVPALRGQPAGAPGITAYVLRGRPVVGPEHIDMDHGLRTTEFERNTMFLLGLGILIAVPAFKTITHLPPFLGILFGLGILWLVGDLIHRHKEDQSKQHLTLAHALSRIDMSSIVFFVGILLAVATLEHTHILTSLARWLDWNIGRLDVIVILIGVFSAVVDNVPLVAASMGMYDLAKYPTDHFLWEFLAYCAGTGGSILIIGSAAGVAAMGLEKIHFFWYVKNISGLALIGYLAGAGTYILQYNLMH